MHEAPRADAPSEPPGAPLRSRIGLVLGPLLCAVALAVPTPAGMSVEAWRTAAVTLLMAVWWISEAIPIPATALVPLVLFPPLGLATIEATAAPYANPVIFLFLGGFMIAAAMQRWGLHRRIALHIIRVVGTRPRNLLGGFMLASAFLSMWISNTATTVMMLPIAISVIELGARDDRNPSGFGTALMLGVAYAASIGGIATLIGTPPNAMLAGFMTETYGVDIGFARWLLVGLPLVALMLPIAWWVLSHVSFRLGVTPIAGGRRYVAESLAQLGAPSRGEVWTAVVFGLTAIAWIARPVLGRWISGLSDAGIAMTGGLLLFALPVSLREGRFALAWEAAAKLPWGVLLLFGGGLSLARAINDNGLAAWIGDSMSRFDAWPLVLVMGMIALVVIFLTELTSNTATAATFLPIVASFAIGMGENPLFLVIPAALAASCAFMLPVATPPNAIVFGSGAVTVPQMSRAGIVLNLIFGLMIPLMAYALVIGVFGGRAGALPPWASP